MSGPEDIPPSELAVPAWHAPAFNPRNRFTAGLLRLSDGRLSFTTDAGVAFDVPVTEVADARFTAATAVLKCQAGGNKWRFFFAQPPGASAAVAAGGLLGAVGGAATAVSGTKAVLNSRHVGKQFEAALLAAQGG
jgi:hypothetical protein